MLGRSFYITIFIMSMTAIFISILIIPNPKEVALMHMEDKYFEQAFSQYKKLFESGDKSIGVVMPLSKLYLQYGDINNAIMLMEKYIEINSHAVSARKQLGMFYQYAQRPDDYLRNLEQISKFDKNVAIFQELADIYNFRGDSEKQIAALEVVINKKNYKIDEKNMVDLAYLYSTRKSYDRARIILDRLLNETKYKVSIDTMELAVSLLIDNNEFDKALAISKEYLKQNYDVNYALIISSRFEQKKQPRMAFTILLPFREQLEKDNSLYEEFIVLQLSVGEEEKAYINMLKIFEKNKLPNSLKESFIELAIAKKDEATIKKILDKLEIKYVRSEILFGLAEITIRNKNKEMAIRIKNLIGKDVLKENPLLASGLELAIRGKEAIGELLLAQKMTKLTNREKLILVSIYDNIGNKELSADIMKDMPIMDALSIFSATDIADIYISIGQGEIGLKYLQTIRAKKTNKTRIDIVDIAWLMLASGMGKEEQVLSWLSKTKEVQLQSWKDAFFQAHKHGHYNLSLKLIEYVYKLDKSQDNIINYADALIRNNKFTSALEILYPIIQKTKEVDYYYLVSLMGFIKENGLEKAIKYEIYIDIITSRKGLNNKEKQNYGFMLYQMGYKEKAQDIFFDLAKSAPADSEEVKQLVYMWEKKVPDYGIDWLTNRTQSAEDNSLHHWFSYLNYTGNSRKTVALARNRSFKDDKASDVYIEALQATKNTQKLKQVIKTELVKPIKYERKRKLSIMAMQENMPKEAQNAFRSLLDERPYDYEIRNNLALMCFYEAKYKEAKNLFDRYFLSNDGDYLSNYAYGEVLWFYKEKQKASKYFDRALKKYNQLVKKDKLAKFVAATILFRKEEIDKSLEIFKELIRNYPKDNDLRADYVNTLLQIGKFEEAEKVLNEAKYYNF